MQLKYKITAALLALVLIIVVVFAIQFYAANRPYTPSSEGNYNLDETFTKADFTYGPQGWIPYNSKLAVQAGGNVDTDQFYLMFVDLNATSNLNATFPCVRVDYALTGLHGTAAFHVYGYINSDQAISWTNRLDGLGASGWYVVGTEGNPAMLSGITPLDEVNHVYVKVSNQNGATYNDFGNNTYYMKFDKAGGGLNTMHITQDFTNPSGEVTFTGNSTGTFYVDFTGDRLQSDFILAVGVDGIIGDDFSLNIKSSVP
jgi:hypothetical protein